MLFTYVDAAVSAGAVVVTLAAVALTGVGPGALPQHALEPLASTVEIAAGTIGFPPTGEYLAAGRPVSPLEAKIEFRRPFRIMRHQVSLGDYQICVDAGACEPSDARQSAIAQQIPVTGVNYLDATAYAEWLSRETGQSWRLPTAAEWAFAAAERFSGESYSPATGDPSNPAIAWIRRYQEESAAARRPDPEPKAKGSIGPNSRTVEDLAGNVWEWTSTCYERASLSVDRSTVLTRTENCGVHVLEGRHRAYMSNFIRDGKSGGCAVGTPPENLGFRLVLDEANAPPGS